MGQQVTITGTEAVALVEQLAALRGVSVEDAVVDAVRSRMDEARRENEEFEALMELTAEFRALLDDSPPGSDHSWMYDENGLPVS